MKNAYSSLTLLTDEPARVGEYVIRPIAFRGESVRLLVEHLVDQSLIEARQPLQFGGRGNSIGLGIEQLGVTIAAEMNIA